METLIMSMYSRIRKAFIGLAFACALMPAAAAGSAGPIVIPLENQKGLLLATLETDKDGEALRLVVDTGAEVTAIEQTHPVIKRAGRGTNVTSQGKVWGQRFYLPKLKAGKQSWTRKQVVASSFLPLRKATGISLDGVLGADLLARHVAVIDYDAKQLKLNRSFGFKPHAEDKLIAATFTRMRPIVTVKLGKEADQDAKALFDSGACGVGLLAYPKLTKKLGKGPSGPERGGTGLQGGFKYAWGRPEHLSLGPFKIRSNTARARTPASPGSTWEAILGSQITGLFTVTLDYPRRKLYLRPGAKLRAFYERAEKSKGSSAKP